MTISLAILGICIAFVVVHSFVELWTDNSDHEIDCTPFGMPEDV